MTYLVHGLLRLREKRQHGVERKAEHTEDEGELVRSAGGRGAAVARGLDDMGCAAVHVRGALHADGGAGDPGGVSLPHRRAAACELYGWHAREKERSARRRTRASARREEAGVARRRRRRSGSRRNERCPPSAVFMVSSRLEPREDAESRGRNNFFVLQSLSLLTLVSP